MVTLKGHFDGKSIVLDEPATLAVGQAVRVVVEPAKAKADSQAQTPGATAFVSRGAAAIAKQKGVFDEREFIANLPPLPKDFVRKPGSGAGEIWIADDFDQTPEAFKDYM